MKKRIVIALGGNALGNTLPEQMVAVKSTSKAIIDLIEEGHEVIVSHGNGPQVGMINQAMIELSRADEKQPNTPLSVCVAMSQAYIGYDLQNALREELLNRGIHLPVATMVTQVRVDADDPAFQNPSKPIGRFMTKEQADIAAAKYGHEMKEDAGRGYRRVVASPKPVVIDFWATWCGPCRVLAPTVEEVAEEMAGKAIVAKCNVDDCEDISIKYGIRNIPTLIFIKNGEVVDRTVGVVSKQDIVARIEKML